MFPGLSADLSADALAVAEPMALDLKLGRREGLHRLSLVGYALVLESLHEFPIYVGCLVYGGFRDGQVTIEREFHALDDEPRQWFVGHEMSGRR